MEAPAQWHVDPSWPHDLTARTTVPGKPSVQYAFEFSAEPIDSDLWSSLLRSTPPDGQVGTLEGINFAQAATLANRRSERDNLETCYEIEACRERPNQSDFACDIEPRDPVSCSGYRLPTRREIDTMNHVDNDTRIAQWTHDGVLVDERALRRSGEDPADVAGALLVRTTEPKARPQD